MDDEEQIIEQKDIKNFNLIEIDKVSEVCGAVGRIQIDNIKGTGFFMKLEKSNKPFYCLITCEHVIKEEMINSGKKVEFNYNNKKSKLNIFLNKDERFIRSYRYINIDATVVEILPEDNINEEFFLLPNMDYINGYEQFEGKEIYIPQFPGEQNLSFSPGEINSVNIYKNEFSNISDTKDGSSGSPIFLKGSILVLGIHKKRKKNLKKKVKFANFLGPIINSLKSNSCVDNETMKIEFNDEKGYGRAIINKDTADYYIGEFNKEFKKDGKGIIFSVDKKIIYEGNFVNDKYSIEGTLYSRDNKIKYKGEFAFGKYEGFGQLFEDKGEYYIGQFINNQKHGEGIKYSKDN